jgi:hypothetical protein
MQQPLQQNININIIQMHSSLRGALTTRSAKYTTDKGRKEISRKKMKNQVLVDMMNLRAKWKTKQADDNSHPNEV